MEKVLAEEIRTCKRKEKEDKQTTKMGSTIKWITKKTLNNCGKTQFIVAWIPIIVIQMGDHFHHDFKVGLQVHLCKYMGANLGYKKWVR